MEKKNNKKGFTLAELLIVVAIIAVLVAVAIPIFSAQLEKSKKAVDEANIRSAYGEAMATYLTETNVNSGVVSLANINYNWNYDASNNVLTVTTASGASLKSSTYAGGITYSGDTNFKPVS